MRKHGYLFLAVCLNLALVACSEQVASTEQSSWSYDEFNGPEYWGELTPENSACVNGREQSPINLEFSQVKADKKLKGMPIYYEPTTITLQNNGHTIQANATDEINSIVIEGNEYRLSQFHFHTPSEHQLNGQNYDMELHLVHKDNNGKLAVLGVMIQEGRENETLASIWAVLPKGKTKKIISKKYLIDLQALLPPNQIALHYDGSLTTPPCTEEVKWIVFEQPIEMSKEQVQAFQQIFSDNHRPVQPLNEREIIKRLR
ncbi:carbonic anhydrase [Lysinibacillus sp. 2017]|uniref:carbonic anhydrase n=1 Tax=unclassified Lysinibacillus TaxID=2636778 RepID=UPI000D529EE7|nr:MULTISPECIES: carbonic anhydrase family protein [unclassified Lysinibacillus]AWE06132.1 carbonic anhydrase [Lysinibacillus sp. 2017]TGN35213.1 carbonic anhydrase family protein [Lysinibacillus sp. S2017]